MAKDPWSVVSQEKVSAPDGWSVVSSEPSQPARRAVNLEEEPPPSGLSGEFTGFADVFAQPAAEPAAVAPARAQPKPYKNRQEALNDAVNMLEEGADQNQVIQSFKGIGVNWNEIIKRGKDRSSPYFREQYVTPEEAARNRAAPRTDAATITGREPGYLEGTANLFKRADTRFGDMATGFLFSTGAFDADQAAFSLREAARQRSAAAPSTAIQEGMEAIGRANTYGEAAEAMLRNPRATFTMLAESLLVTAPTLAATIATAPAGAAVRAGITFAGSGAMEYTSVMADVLQDKGIDLMDPAKVSMALRDPKVLDEIKEKGAKRGLIVGAFDALSMGLAGRFMQPANDLIAAGKLTGSAAKKATVAAWGKELALQMGAGAGGEFAAQKATGEDRPADVLLEALAEGVSAPVDVYSSLRNLPPSAAAQLARAIEEDSEQAGVTPEGLRMRSALETAQPPRPRVEPRLQPGALPVPAEERREPTGGFEVVRQEPSAPEDMVVPGMPTGDELEELAPPAPPAAAAPAEEAPAAPASPAAPPAATAPPTATKEGARPGAATAFDFFGGLSNELVTSFTKDTSLSPELMQAATQELQKRQAAAPAVPAKTKATMQDVIEGMTDAELQDARNNVMFSPPAVESEIAKRQEQAAKAKEQQAKTQEVQKLILQNRDRGGQASREQMESIARAPDYDRAGFSNTPDGAPIVAFSDIPANQLGRTGKVTTAGGKKIPIQYGVVEADEILTSNDINGSPDKRYGDPSIPGLRAIAGNGRVTGIRDGFRRGTADAYRQAMMDDDLHQVSPDVIAGMRNPILVRLMPQESLSPTIGDELNQGSMLELSAVEQAKTDLNRVDFDTLSFSADGDVTPQSVNQFINSMPAAERGKLVDKGVPTRQAYQRLENAIFARAYQDDALISLFAQSQDPEARLLVSALMQVAPAMSRLEGAGNLDIREIVTDAAKMIISGKRRGLKLSEIAAQADMTTNPDSLLVVQLFAANPRSNKAAVEALNNLASVAYQEYVKPEEGLFGAQPKIGRAELLTKIGGKYEPTTVAGTEGAGAAPSDVQGKAKPGAAGVSDADQGLAFVGETEAEIKAKRDAAEERVAAEQPADNMDTPAEEAAQIKDKTIRDKLKEVADNLGVRVFETSDRPVARDGYVQIPPEDKLVEGSQSAEQVFAHELGHAIMQKRGMGFNQMSHEQVAKWIKGWPQIREISKAFRPEVYKSKMPKTRRHANKPDEIIADALGSFLLGQSAREQIKPLLDGIGLTDYDLGLKKFDRRAAEDKALAKIEAERLLKAQTADELRQKAEREAEAEKRQREEKAEAERKAKADAERDEFVLTGSDRAADEAAARGQADIFGAPPTEVPKAANPIKALEQSGFVRVPNGNPKQYVDKGGQPYLTMERGPVRIALQPSELLFVDKKAVIKGMDEDAFTLAALLVEPDARGQGLARKALQDVIKTTDSFDKDLYLEPAPLDDQPMSQEQLIKFYKSVGFEFQPNSNNKVMVRKAGATVPAETVAKAPAEEPAKPIGAAVMGQRQINAADRFRKAAMGQFKLTQEQADAAMGRLIKDKVLILDPVTGQFELKDGRFWDREVLLKAAGEKPVKIEEPKEVAAARKEMKKVKPGEVITPAELARRKKLIEYEKKQKGKEYEAAGAVVVNDKTPSADLPASKRLVIMPCCDMKGAEKAPAMELYKGVFFQTFRSNAQEGGRPNVVILSAKHGFIAPTKEIEPYDQMMTSSRSDEMLVDLPRLISNLQIPEGIEDVLIVGGKDYQRVMKAAVAELQKDGTISENASVNATSGGIGDQRKQLGEYLRSIEGDLPAGKVDVLENIEPKNKAEQIGFGFDTQAADEVSRNNPTVAQTLARANQLPGAKKKLPPGRSPELAAAAKQVQAGLMTAKEFDELVNRYKPIPVYFAPLKPATSEQVYNALDSAKREKIDPNISTGYPVGLRLDIPAFNRHGVFVVSIHEKRTPSSPGKVIGYSSVASIKDVTFGVGNQKEALRIATGEAKDAIQTMEGKYNPITPEQAYQIADDAILSGDWVQVGFDPTRHAYFFDRRTTVPVVAAEEVIQIGNMILAKGVTYGKKDEFLYNIGSDLKREAFFGDKSLREYQIERYAGLRQKIAATLKKVAKGDINIDMQRNLTRMMQESRELQAQIKSSAPRRDSAERFMAKALEEYDKGNIDAEVLAVVEQVYQKFPELLEGLLLSVKKGGGYTAGSFGSISRIITLFKETSGVYNPMTIRHELSHSLEQMMTPEQASIVVQAWTKALAKAIKQNPDAQHQKYFNAILDFIENPTNATLKKAQDALPSYEMYQFINPSEYWAVNAERLLGAELGPVWGRFKKAVRKLFEAIKNIFGFDNTYAIHKVFDQVMGGKKERITNRVIAEMITGVEGEFTTLKNIEDEKELMEKYSRPKTPMLDQTPTKTFITRQFKNGKEFFSDAAKNPKEAMVGSGNAVMDGLIYMRNKNVWYGSGLEARDFDRYNGELRTSEGMATASVALDNAIRSGNIGVEVIFRGGIAYDRGKNNFVAVERQLGMKGVYEAEAAIKARLGDQLGTDIVQGYLEAKRSISIKDELYEREAALEDAKQNLEAMRALRRAPEEIAQAQALVDDSESDVEAIKKAVSSVNMSEEEMGEFAALDEKHPELKDLMRNWTAVNQNLLKFWRQVGLLSAGRYEKLSAIKDYVPWYRIMNDELDLHDSDQSAVQSTTRSMTNIGREKLFKRGRPISVVDFRAKEGQQDFKIQPSSVVKVKVNGQAVDPSRVSVTSSGEVRIDMPLEENDLVVFETNREIENIIDNMTRNVMRMTMNGIRQFAANRIVLEYASRNENGKIMVFPKVDKNKGRFNWIVNGKKVVVEIQDPLVAASIYGMENLNLQMWAPLAAVANFTRRTITLSGVFQIKQVFKDAPTAALVTGVKNPLALIGGVYKGFITSLTNTDPVVDILKAAGIGGYMSPARTPEAEIKRRLGIMNRNVFDFVIKGLDHIGDASDMAQRVATYKRVLAETGDETQALYQAANVINFLHHGSAGYAQAIVKTVPFMGAYANATDVLVRALVGGGLKGVSRKRALARLSMTMAVLSSLTLLYAMLAGGDPEYDELDDQTKLRNIIIPGTKIMLPMNTSAAYFFKAIPELIYNQVTREGTENEMDRKRLRKALADAARDMLLGPEPIPAGVKPLLEVAINHSFFTGRPVIPEGMKDLEAAEQYTAATSELGKKMSAMLEIPGTDGKRVISPVQADHLIRGIFGTAGAMGQWVSNSIGAMAETRPAPTDRETPITGSFLRPDIPRGREDLFYDFKERVDKKYATYMKMVEREDDQAADAYLEKHGDLVGMKDYITETEEELKEINAEIRRIGTTRSKDMSPEERRKEMDDYQRLKLEILEPVKEMRREAFGTGLVAK